MDTRSANKIYEYIEALYNNASLPEAEQHHMQISKLEGMIIGILLKSINAKNILEIGTLHGYSALCMQHFLGEDARITTVEKSHESYLKAQENLKGHTNIECINSDAIEFLQNYQPTHPIDAVFIDADKTNYSNYFKMSLPLLRSGGLIIADNTLMHGEVIPQSTSQFRASTINSIKEFNILVSKCEDVDSIIIPTISGLTIALKR